MIGDLWCRSHICRGLFPRPYPWCLRLLWDIPFAINCLVIIRCSRNLIRAFIPPLSLNKMFEWEHYSKINLLHSRWHILLPLITLLRALTHRSKFWTRLIPGMSHMFLQFRIVGCRPGLFGLIWDRLVGSKILDIFEFMLESGHGTIWLPQKLPQTHFLLWINALILSFLVLMA